MVQPAATPPFGSTRDGTVSLISAEVAREFLACAVESEHELPAAVRNFLERAGA
jgi:hypothetical protein